MLSSRTLDPEQRVIYGASLQPPPAYVFDAAVATTYSLDFETALAVPVSLALFSVENREDILYHPLALLEGAERIAGRLAIFAEAGHIQAQSSPQSRLCSLLERIIVEVRAPRDGAFHPKMWVLRYKPMDLGDPPLLRLLVLSRNLTRDRSWDIALTLDGVITARSRAVNRPLFDLIRRLPDLANAILPEHARALAEQLANDVRHTDWTIPQPFESVSFSVNGISGKGWQPERCSRLGIISPFCDDQTLSLLAGLATAEKPVLIGRPDELACLQSTTLEQFGRVAVLDDMAATEDGEDPSSEALVGLHAKVFIAEKSWDTEVTVGSGNATRPAVISGRNVELFATLTGRRSRVGGVDDILGEKGFGRLTRDFAVTELGVPDPEIRVAEVRVEAARRAICRSGLVLRCERSDVDETAEVLWQVWLIPPNPLLLPGIGRLTLWPITRGESHYRDALAALRQGQPVDLGTMPLIDLTRFVAFRLVDTTDKVSALFSTGLVIEGLPAARDAAILRWTIDSRDAFFRYLRLLLADLGDPFAAVLAAQTGGAQKRWTASPEDEALLEDLGSGLITSN